MIMFKNKSMCRISVTLCCLFFYSVFPSFAAEQYEKEVDLRASSFLPENLLKSDLYKIEETVKNDGFINTYVLQAGTDSYQTSSNIGLLKLLGEIEAIVAMQKVQESDAFINSLKESGVATVEGLKNLFSDPGDTIEKAASGINSLFSRAEESIFNSSPGASEDSRIAQTVGFSSAKREVAFRYKVDVYSANPLLQEHLDRIAWAEYAGGLTLGVATMPIGGAVGVTLSVSGTARLLGEIIATTPPAELKLENRKKLGALGIDADLADLFIENPHFSPLQQTVFVMALEKNQTAENKSFPLQVALQVNDRDMARYMTAIMSMFAGYQNKINTIVKYTKVARVFGGVDDKGKVIVMLPADYITWNARIDKGLGSIKIEGTNKFELWTIGSVSELAKKSISAAGWHVEEDVETKIGFKTKK